MNKQRAGRTKGEGREGRSKENNLRTLKLLKGKKRNVERRKCREAVKAERREKGKRVRVR